MMHRYSVFGGTLESALALDELPAAAPGAAPTWRLSVAVPSDAPALGTPLGVDTVYGDCRVRGFRSPATWSLVFDDTGRFDVSADGGRLTWFQPPEASIHAAVADITSRVLALALHARGVFALHASAVSLEGGAVAFMAPKHHGKSTLCGALVLAGGRALSDDTVPVELGPTPRLLPGIPKLRLWSDTAGRMFGLGEEGAAPRKHLVEELTATQVESGPVAFRAAYVLNPVGELPDGAAVERSRLGPVEAAMAVVLHAKLGPILSGAESADLLSKAARVAGAVPVYRLTVVRDLERVDEAAGTIKEWHRAVGGPGR